jgi:glycosyltransferase involved in cell wall biosynthesis
MSLSFITWYPSCRRSDALAQALGGTSHLIHYLTFKKPLHAPIKYVLQAGDTIRRLRRERPRIVAVASPPVFAVLAVWAYCRLFSARYVIDAHTGVFDDSRWTWLLPLSRCLARQAAANIVTSSHLEAKVAAWGATAVVIGDVPVQFQASQPADLGQGAHIAVINTFSQDEPLDQVLAAAASLPEVTFHITGNPQHARNRYHAALPPNARFTGWLSDEAYTGLLLAARAVICLTTRDHTMQRGAYEAMALGKPLITSDWKLLRQTFSAGTIHIDNSADAIVSAVRRTLRQGGELEHEMRALRRQRRSEFHAKLDMLKQILDRS